MYHPEIQLFWMCQLQTRHILGENVTEVIDRGADETEAISSVKHFLRAMARKTGMYHAEIQLFRAYQVQTRSILREHFAEVINRGLVFRPVDRTEVVF